MKRYYLFLAVLTTVSLAAIGLQAGLARGAVSDKTKEQDLTQINTKIVDFAQSNKRLPAGLNELTLGDTIKIHLKDYEYKTKNDYTYELCATFKTAKGTKYASNGGSYGYITTYYHAKGHVCFTATDDNLKYVLEQAKVKAAPVAVAGDPGCTAPAKDVTPIAGTFASTNRQNNLNYLNFNVGSTQDSFIYCDSVSVLDKTGKPITLASLKAGDLINVFETAAPYSKVYKVQKR